MIQSCRKVMLCAICLAVALTQVVLAQHDTRQAQANIIGSNVAVNFHGSVGYGNSEGGIIEIGLMPQKRNQEVAVVKPNAIEEVKQDAIYIPTAERNTTDEVSVKQVETYNPVVVQSINYAIAKKATEEVPINPEEIYKAVATRKALVELYPENAINEVSQEETHKLFEAMNNLDTLKF